MPNTDYPDDWYAIDTTIYHRSVKMISAVTKLLSVKIKIHGDSQVQEGDIFLFNHFARFETFIPQFLIFEQTGAYSCAVASSEFFKDDSLLASYLQKVGALPHDHPRLFSLLAAHILRGHKVIIFPEGGMVKDHRVLDHQGQYNIYSRISGERRKQHTGAAVLAQGLEIFKAAIRKTYNAKNHAQLARWQEHLKLDSVDQLLINALKPTRIIPANITFYPIQTSKNWLSTGVELFTNNLSFRQTEELLVEGNILLKNTDMDIRMGQPIDPCITSTWWSRQLLQATTADFDSLDAVFAINASPKNCQQHLLGLYLKSNAINIRNQYMQAIYTNVTVNLSHLAATLIMHCIENGRNTISRSDFLTALYIAVKHLQHNTHINLHRSLLNPLDYNDLITGTSTRFQHFIHAAQDSELLIEHADSYQFLPKLLQEQDFDSIRLENLIAVYDNEVEPITAVRDTIISALAQCHTFDKKQLAAWYFEDECRDLIWEYHAYRKSQYNDINSQETAEADPSPFLLTPESSNSVGVLLIHGLLASPAELKDYGNHLVQQGYTVMGVRLKGHGSSPYALRQQTFEDWYASVLRGFDILSAHCPQIFVSGFSTGGALALKLAAEKRPQIIGVCASAVPVKFVNPAFMLVPLLHSANTLIDWLSSYEGIKPFIENGSEHPLINYRHMPVKSLYELRRLIEAMNACLADIDIPVLIVQADNDPVVAFKSATDIMDKLTTVQKQLVVINTHRHGILMDNIGGTWDAIRTFMCSCQPVTTCLTASADYATAHVSDKTTVTSLKQPL
ncbi:alpha/beta fold hydrolase [Crenothrix polyspora]|uniref:Esterase/lipase n=1 Tax=Crenothrix polyspora TaxID=360316 RepID=A0A1R4H0V1_9GAMM|nr:alpha/beta fold hydrolase [Crenothrix polyspora]SJM89848.1 Esterase/lipase [Crenothrix polyspora]